MIVTQDEDNRWLAAERKRHGERHDLSIDRPFNGWWLVCPVEEAGRVNRFRAGLEKAAS